MSRYVVPFYPAASSGVTSVDSSNGKREIRNDPMRRSSARIVLDSANFDTSYTINDKQLVARFDPLKNVSGIKLVRCVVPRYFGKVAHAVLTAIMEDGNRFYLHAFAPETATIPEIGDVFRANLEEDAKRATTASFSSPWFQNLTIKATQSGFVVLEYYAGATAATNVRTVELDVHEFDGLRNTVETRYDGGLLTNFGGSAPSLEISSASQGNINAANPQSYTKGIWTFCSDNRSIHSRYGCPYVCVSEIGDVAAPINGDGNVSTLATCEIPHPGGAETQAKAHVIVRSNVIRAVVIDNGGTGYPVNTEFKIAFNNIFTGQSDGSGIAVSDASGVIVKTLIVDGGQGYLQAGTTATLLDMTSNSPVTPTGDSASFTVLVAKRGVGHIHATTGSGYTDTDLLSMPTVHVKGVRETTSATAPPRIVGSDPALPQSTPLTTTPAIAAYRVVGGQVSAVFIEDAGEGYPLGHTPHIKDALCPLINGSLSDPFTGGGVTRWFTTPLASLQQLAVSLRCFDDSEYPLSSGRAVFEFEIYCNND